MCVRQHVQLNAEAARKIARKALRRAVGLPETSPQLIGVLIDPRSVGRILSAAVYHACSERA